MTRHYYAKQSPRGFANEVNVIRFANRSARDRWVSEHSDDGGSNSAACGASAVTAARARQLSGYRADAVIDA